MGVRDTSKMAIKLDNLQEICNLVTRQVQELYPDLQAMFIPHAGGMFHEVVSFNEYELTKHPAGKIAQAILEKNNNKDQSSFLGMAISHQVKWFGLASNDKMLALFNINTDEFKDAKEARRTIYHLVWHAIDLIEVRRRPEYVSKFRSGPMIPKRSPMNLARLNLQADVFSAVMCALQGENDALEVLALQRANDSISMIHARRAEDYPYVIALEATQYAFKELTAIKPPRPKYMFYARQLAIEVGHTFDDTSIRQWWGFSEPGQDMAWRNFSREIILGCAVNTSDDPFVRATGHLIADISGITPLPGLKLGASYNAYATSETNKTLHREMMEKTFEEAIARGALEESGQPLLSAANAQNEGLAEGIILGWCGHALQAAARAFESAMSSGMSPTQAARLEFEGNKDSTAWEMLKKIGETIVDQKRKGFAVTLGNVAEICNDNPDFAPVLGAIRVTMKDPNYIQKLQAANDFTLHRTPALSGPTPSAPTPKGPAPQAPAYATPAMAAPVPGLGGNNAAAAARHRAMMDRMAKDKAQSSEEDRVS